MQKINQIKHTVAVASGKGGVGKSTVTANLALALAEDGYSVGVLDADIYGPSQGRMLGVAESVRPQSVRIDGKAYYVPVTAYGLQVMSIAFLTDERTPMVWRGPMASGALQQMLLQTSWGSLDFLLVDMPPGTGDIQLTLSQKASLSGSVIVTTPQDIALQDAMRAIEMFKKVNVPTLGIVENMAGHICPKCQHHDAVFGQGGGERLSQDYAVPLLGSLPLAASIQAQTDGGRPTVIASEGSNDCAHYYKDIAKNLLKQLDEGHASLQLPDISIDE